MVALPATGDDWREVNEVNLIVNILTFNETSKNIGKFLVEVGKAVQEAGDMPTIGVLATNKAIIQEFHMTENTLTLSLVSSVKLQGVKFAVEGGRSFCVSNLLLAGVKIECKLLPVVDGDTVKLFDVIHGDVHGTTGKD